MGSLANTAGGVSIPTFQPDGTRHRRDIAQWAQWANQGHLACKGSVTLAAGTTTTTVTDARVSVNSIVMFSPRTANAAAAKSTMLISVTDGAFTITHANTATTDRTFDYALLG